MEKNTLWGESVIGWGWIGGEEMERVFQENALQTYMKAFLWKNNFSRIVAGSSTSQLHSSKEKEITASTSFKYMWLLIFFLS